MIPCLCQVIHYAEYTAAYNFLSCHVALLGCHSGLHFVLMWTFSVRVETLSDCSFSVHLAWWAQPTSNPT